MAGNWYYASLATPVENVGQHVMSDLYFKPFMKLEANHEDVHVWLLDLNIPNQEESQVDPTQEVIQDLLVGGVLADIVSTLEDPISMVSGSLDWFGEDSNGMVDQNINQENSENVVLALAATSW
jgi:hypothetical protein